MPRPRRSLWDRVMAKVVLPADPQAQCWTWTGATSTKRDGTKRPSIKVNGVTNAVTHVARVVCEWYHGPPPGAGDEAGHTCPDQENPGCVSPHHLRWMTKVENLEYQAQRRRDARRAD